MRDYYEIWWEQVTGARGFVEAIVRNIYNETATVVCVPKQLPWDEQMRSVIIKDKIDTDKWFNIIDSTDDLEDIGFFLLRTLFEEDVVSTYTYCSRTTSVDTYFRKKNLLQNRVVWVKNISEKSLVKWLTFLKKYKNFKNSFGAFILEVSDDDINKQNNIDVLRYYDYVSKYDVHLFASIVASLNKNEQQLHQYMTFVADSLCELDVELIVRFINSTDFVDAPIIEDFKKLCNIYSDSTLSHNLWRAQIQVAFPLIEEARVCFVKKYEQSIEQCLPVDQFDVQIRNPYEVEIGTLMYLLSRKREEEGSCRLVIYQQDFEQICFLHNIRNNLAHLKHCDANIIFKLLSTSFFESTANRAAMV